MAQPMIHFDVPCDSASPINGRDASLKPHPSKAKPNHMAELFGKPWDESNEALNLHLSNLCLDDINLSFGDSRAAPPAAVQECEDFVPSPTMKPSPVMPRVTSLSCSQFNERLGAEWVFEPGQSDSVGHDVSTTSSSIADPKFMKMSTSVTSELKAKTDGGSTSPRFISTIYSDRFTGNPSYAPFNSVFSTVSEYSVPQGYATSPFSASVHVADLEDEFSSNENDPETSKSLLFPGTFEPTKPSSTSEVSPSSVQRNSMQYFRDPLTSGLNQFSPSLSTLQEPGTMSQSVHRYRDKVASTLAYLRASPQQGFYKSGTESPSPPPSANGQDLLLPSDPRHFLGLQENSRINQKLVAAAQFDRFKGSSPRGPYQPAPLFSEADISDQFGSHSGGKHHDAQDQLSKASLHGTHQLNDACLQQRSLPYPNSKLDVVLPSTDLKHIVSLTTHANAVAAAASISRLKPQELLLTLTRARDALSEAKAILDALVDTTLKAYSSKAAYDDPNHGDASDPNAPPSHGTHQSERPDFSDQTLLQQQKSSQSQYATVIEALVATLNTIAPGYFDCKRCDVASSLFRLCAAMQDSEAIVVGRRRIILAHPDEFKNPSSFLKVYGDPQCTRTQKKDNTDAAAEHPKKGKNGNWECSQCYNINYPRRYRCNNYVCRAFRDAEGDRLVSEYTHHVFGIYLINQTRQQQQQQQQQQQSNQAPSPTSFCDKYARSLRMPMQIDKPFSPRSPPSTLDPFHLKMPHKQPGVRLKADSVQLKSQHPKNYMSRNHLNHPRHNQSGFMNTASGGGGGCPLPGKSSKAKHLMSSMLNHQQQHQMNNLGLSYNMMNAANKLQQDHLH